MINFVTQIVDGLNIDGGLARVAIMMLVCFSVGFFSLLRVKFNANLRGGLLLREQKLFLRRE